MLRLLKWVFLTFLTLGLLIMIFFYSQNRVDLHLYFEHKDSLSYDAIEATCSKTNDSYYFDCFQVNFENYLEKVSLTGTSFGLRSAFSFIDEDKKQNKLFDGAENDVRFALNYLKVNNLALENSIKRFHGFDFTYGGYIGKIKDFNEKAVQFSQGIIEGLRSDEGINALPMTERKIYNEELISLEREFERVSKTVQDWLDKNIEKLKLKHDVD